MGGAGARQMGLLLQLVLQLGLGALEDETLRDESVALLYSWWQIKMKLELP